MYFTIQDILFEKVCFIKLVNFLTYIVSKLGNVIVKKLNPPKTDRLKILTFNSICTMSEASGHE